MRIAIGTNKGGSGKTTTTVNLAAALAESGHRVLVVDLDPQANASRRLGVRFDPKDPILTLAEALEASRPGTTAAADEVIVPSAWPEPYAGRVDLCPSRFDLENRISEAATVGAVGRLRRALEGVDGDYTATLIDCPPSLGHLTQLALAAADCAIGTLEPEYDSVEGALRLRDFIANAAGELGNPTLALLGVIVCRVRSGLGAHSFQLDGLAELFGTELVWAPTVPERAAIKDAADAALPLTAFGGIRAADCAEIYRDLATHILKQKEAL